MGQGQKDYPLHYLCALSLFREEIIVLFIYVLSHSTTLYISFLKRCTLPNKAVGTI